MKTLILTIAVILITLSAIAQTKKPVIVERTFGRYTSMPSTYQVKTIDSLRQAGFKPMGIRYIANGRMIVRFIKAS